MSRSAGPNQVVLFAKSRYPLTPKNSNVLVQLASVAQVREFVGQLSLGYLEEGCSEIGTLGYAAQHLFRFRLQYNHNSDGNDDADDGNFHLAAVGDFFLNTARQIEEMARVHEIEFDLAGHMCAFLLAGLQETAVNSGASVADALPEVECSFGNAEAEWPPLYRHTEF